MRELLISKQLLRILQLLPSGGSHILHTFSYNFNADNTNLWLWHAADIPLSHKIYLKDMFAILSPQLKFHVQEINAFPTLITTSSSSFLGLLVTTSIQTSLHKNSKSHLFLSSYSVNSQVLYILPLQFFHFSYLSFSFSPM